MPISANAGEYKSVIGLDSLYIAEVTQDTAAGYTAGTPEFLAPAANAVHEPSVTTLVQWMDDQPYDVMSAQGETKITLTISGLPAEMLAWITGATFDASSGRVFDNANPALAPYFALLFRSQKSNGSYRYYCYLKGKFSPPKEESATKTDKPDPKSAQVEFLAIKTIYEFNLGTLTDSVKRVWGDEDTDSFVATGWFSQVQTPATVTPSALALSASDPADGASGVAVSKTITLTFNNALKNDAIYNVVVVKADGTHVAAVKSLDTDKKVMTVDPSASLNASSTYIVSIGVTDVYGSHLSTAINFGTA